MTSLTRVMCFAFTINTVLAHPSANVTTQDLCNEYPDPASCDSNPYCLYSPSDSTCKSCPFAGNTCHYTEACCDGAGCDPGDSVCKVCDTMTHSSGCASCSGFYWTGSNCEACPACNVITDTDTCSTCGCAWAGSKCATPETVVIGSSGDNTKCAAASKGLTCAADAGNRGKRVNPDFADADDAFIISVRGSQVCAQRTDSGGGWVENLAVRCLLGADLLV